jgi:hypothetical protein
MQERVRSGNKMLPQPQGNIVRQRQQLENYSRQLFSKQTSRSTNYRNSSAPFTASSRTRPHYPQTPSPNPNSEFQITRPFTESGKCHRRAYSPLEVIRTRSKCESRDTLQVEPVKSTPVLKANFLRKGSALDKAVITNVLKSKLNTNISASIFSYGDVASNKEIAELVSAQIPKGVRDVVGVEEMMRMSHILTGAQFKSVSLTHKLNRKLAEGRRRDSTVHGDDEDNITLRSIKRW